MDPAALRRRVQESWSALKTERSSYESHWRDLADVFVPRQLRLVPTDASRQGTKRNDKILNGGPLRAARTLASGMMAGLTSPARPWFRLVTPDADLNERPDVKGWLYQVEQRMRDVFAQSNLYNALPTAYHDLGVFAVHAMAVLEDDESVIRCHPFVVGSYVLATSERGTVDTLIRELRMTPRQMAQRFGMEALSVGTQAAARSPGEADKPRTVLHALMPNPSPDPRRADWHGMPVLSIYCEPGAAEGGVLRIAGFREFPVLAPRWDVISDEVYGRSPGMDALGDARALQLVEKRSINLLDKMTDPPLTAPASLKNAGATLVPGTINWLSGAAGGETVTPTYTPDPRALQFAEEKARQLEGRVSSMMYEDLFLMLTLSDRRQITAREIEERHEEKLLMLGPVLERLNDELLDPLIDRTFSVMWRRGLIPEPPRDLQGTDIRPEYISILAQAQRAVAIGGMERFLILAGSVAQLNPSAIQKVDADQVLDEAATVLGVPPTIIVPDDVLAERRAAEAQQQATMQAAAMAQPVARAARDASETVLPDGSSVLDAILSPSGAVA